MDRTQFSGDVVVRWLPDDPRKMQLLNTITFTDNNKLVWRALEYSIVDGASIPAAFWPIIGSPFAGYYRRASVFHDVYCDNHLAPSKLVHRMFWEAMIADGVTYQMADIMYKAVKNFGPSW